jgi:hypothetical protein
MPHRPSLASCKLAVLAALALAATSACHSAGPYGYAPRYVELSDETAAATGAREYDPVMVERQPEEWRKGRVVLIGVVESRSAGPGGQALLKLSVRRLEPRNLCQSQSDEDTCRVTVSDKDFGSVSALVQLRGGDDVGPQAVGQRSLLRIVGSLGQDVSRGDGTSVLHASYYRHWPAYYYVTHASAPIMRQ